MGNIHHRVNMVLVTYLVMAMSAHECLNSQDDQATVSTDFTPKSTSDEPNG